jgi:hypothetical protein
MVFAAGFAIERSTRPYCVPFGASHPKLRGRTARRDALFQRLLTGGTGVPHSAVLASPRV